jgi:hypothetical protein
LGNGNRERQQRGECGNPRVLGEQLRIRFIGLPGDPDGEVVTKSPQLVGPTARSELERSIGEIGMLVPQQISDELDAQLDLLGGPFAAGHDRGRYQPTISVRNARTPGLRLPT